MDKRNIKIGPSSRFQFAANFYELVPVLDEVIANFIFNDGSRDPAECVTLIIDKRSIGNVHDNWQLLEKKIEEKGQALDNLEFSAWEKVNKKTQRVAPPSRCFGMSFQRLNNVAFINSIYLNPRATEAEGPITVQSFIEISLNMGQCYNFVKELGKYKDGE